MLTPRDSFIQESDTGFIQQSDTGLIQERVTEIRQWLNSQIVGQPQLIDRLLIALIADGHLLVEGVAA